MVKSGESWIKKTFPNVVKKCTPASFDKLFSKEYKQDQKLCDRLQKTLGECSVSDIEYLYPQEQSLLYKVSLSCTKNPHTSALVTIKKKSKTFKYDDISFSVKIAR